MATKLRDDVEATRGGGGGSERVSKRTLHRIAPLRFFASGSVAVRHLAS